MKPELKADNPQRPTGVAVQRVVRRRPAPILPTLKDAVKPGGYEGAIMRYHPKRKIIVRIFDENLKEMRFKKHLIYDALKNQYLIGQVKRDEIGTKKCVGYAIGHVLVRRKGCAIHIMRVKEWRKLAYAELAGDRQPVMTKTPAISTLASSNGSATPEEWWAKRASELAQQMKVGGVGELRLLRLPTGKYEFEITPEGWPNAESSHRDQPT